MSDARLRAWWWSRQGLDGSLAGASPAEILERSGWSRSVGGVGPYLTLFARGGTSREDADAAVQRLEIHELPTARGCTYVVPASDFALGLKVGEAFGGSEAKVAAKLGVPDREISALCDAVLRALDGQALDPAGIREAVGTAARSLGDEGKKKGLTTTLPVALGRLQTEGKIRRVPVNGRLDQQRYAYARWDDNPLQSLGLSAADAYTELARRYFRWVGPATLKEFQWFSALGVKASVEAIASLGLVPVEPGSDRMLLPEDVDAYRTLKPPTKPQYALVSSLDAITAMRRDVRSFLDDADYERSVRLEKSVAKLGGLSDLPDHAIFDRGRLVGLWEYDPQTESIVWASFGARDKGVEAAVKRMETFVREQLGDARTFSLDSPQSRAPRMEALRAMG